MIDDEATAFFLGLELQALVRQNRISLTDLQLSPRTIGRVLDELVQQLRDGGSVTLSLVRRTVIADDEFSGDYVRLEVTPSGALEPGVKRSRLFDWDTRVGTFCEVPPVNSSWYSGLLQRIV
jgi:hypothetical protein